MWNWLEKATELKSKNIRFAIVTVARVSGSSPREVGAKMLVTEDSFFGTIGGGQLELLALADARKCLLSTMPDYISYPLGPQAGQCCGGLVEVMVETVSQENNLWVFGAGHVGQAIAQVFDGTPIKVTLIDERPEWADTTKVPRSAEVFCGNYKEFLKQNESKIKSTMTAVMTHSHDLDLEIVAELLKSKPKYLGLIGSESKWRRFEYKLKNLNFAEEDLQSIKCPLGLPNGGKSPKEVAISLAQELLQKIHEQDAKL